MPSLSEDLQAAGFSTGEISANLAAERSKLAAAGFNSAEIEADLGVGTFREQPLGNHVAQGRAVAAGRAALASASHVKLATSS